MFRTFGAFGISIKREFAKKDILLLASRFVGTSIADSFTVSKRWSLFIWNQHKVGIVDKQDQQKYYTRNYVLSTKNGGWKSNLFSPCIWFRHGELNSFSKQLVLVIKRCHCFMFSRISTVYGLQYSLKREKHIAQATIISTVHLKKTLNIEA